MQDKEREFHHLHWDWASLQCIVVLCNYHKYWTPSGSKTLNYGQDSNKPFDSLQLGVEE